MRTKTPKKLGMTRPEGLPPPPPGPNCQLIGKKTDWYPSLLHKNLLVAFAGTRRPQQFLEQPAGE